MGWRFWKGYRGGPAGDVRRGFQAYMPRRAASAIPGTRHEAMSMNKSASARITPSRRGPTPVAFTGVAGDVSKNGPLEGGEQNMYF